MNCLTNYIGLKSCNAQQPLSGLYINDLPGMSNEFLNAIATQDQPSFIQMYESVQRVVLEQIKSQVRASLYEIAEATMDQSLFFTKRPTVFTQQVIQPASAEAKYKGIWVSAFGSKYLQMRVNSVWIYNSGAEAQYVPLKIFSTFDWSVLYETTITVPSGFSEVAINQVIDLQFDGLNVFLAIDTTDVPTIKNPWLSDLSEWGVSDCACANRGPNHYWNYQDWTIYPVTMPLNVALPDKIKTDFNQSGVMFNLELICSTESFICANREHLKMFIAYALAEQILLNKLAGFNQNFHATFNPEQTERTMVTFRGMKEMALKTWAKSVNLSGEDMCFSCGDAQYIQSVGVRS
jgi:hypothetical protein